MESFDLLGTIIRKARISHKYEPSDVIALMSTPISQAYYLKIEANQIIPGPTILQQICSVLTIDKDSIWQALSRVKRPTKFYPNKKAFIIKACWHIVIMVYSHANQSTIHRSIIFEMLDNQLKLLWIDNQDFINQFPYRKQDVLQNQLGVVCPS